MIVITGVSGGIGKKIAVELSNYDSVIGIYSSNKVFFERRSISTIKLNLNDEQSIIEFVKNSHLTRITVIHLATVSINGLIANYSRSNWDHTIDVNITGNYLITKHLLPIMINEKWGRIIHFSSVVAQKGERGAIAYGMSKSAISGFSSGLSQEYGRFNITSNVLSLGYMETGLIDTLDIKSKKEILRKIPINKFGDINSIVNAVKFIIESDYINGSEINIDGGFR
jgi:NAD(P)-dependent dehydrogenase (short-subunit alcohol dehydrogenase family)